LKCPHCKTSFHEDWKATILAGGKYYWHSQIAICPACDKDIVRVGLSDSNALPAKWQQVFPIGSNRGPVAAEVPAEIAADYTEAALVLPISAKASAALSRRCLQSVLGQAGYTQKDLSQQIDAVLAEQDTRKALPSGVHSIVDAIRNFGNFSAHGITDKTTLQIIDVQPHEAEYCLDILDAVFDHYYVKPAEAKRMKDALNEKLAAAKKPPVK
jgi:hypothetical protein